MELNLNVNMGMKFLASESGGRRQKEQSLIYVWESQNSGIID